ncbi:T9SS type A sorting domain-containing protein, partial [Flavobacterium sp.]
VQISKPAIVNCWDNFVFNSKTCSWENIGTQASQPEFVNCWDNFVFNITTCTWDNIGVQDLEPAKVNCWDYFIFNSKTCTWHNNGAQPSQPNVVNCWDNYVFNTTTCSWDNTGTQSAEPTAVNCWDDFVFNSKTCSWKNIGTQTLQPDLVNCWDNFVFNTTTCTWENTVTQSAEPTAVNCWDDFVFNSKTCSWKNIGTQTLQPDLVNCWDNFVFNTTTCTWENIGVQDLEPVKVNCWDYFIFNSKTCTWHNNGTQPSQPALVNCWDNFVFNTKTCTWKNIGVQPLKPSVSVVKQPTCSKATGSFSINNYNSSYTYVITPSTGVTISGNTVTAPTGTYSITATSGGCTSVAVSVCVNIQPAQPVAATVSITQPTCTTGTGSILVTAPTGTGLTYSINGSTYQIGNSFTSLSSGSYSIKVKNVSGCISNTTVAIINSQTIAPAQVTICSVTQPTCSKATGSFTISNYNASYTYVVTPSIGVMVSGNTVTVPTGTYTIKAKSGDCTSIVSITITINAQPAAPAQVTICSVTQPTCAIATGSFSITNYNASYTYVVTPSTGVTISGNTVTAPTGTYTIRATSGGCNSAAISVSVKAQPSQPLAPSVLITQPSCTISTGTIVVTAPTGTNFTYSINGFAYQSGNMFSGLASGTYSIKVKNTAGCISTATVAVINTQTVAPAKVTLGSVKQPNCSTSTGSFIITNYNASYTYVVTPSIGVTISGNMVTTPAGIYTVTATVGSCSSIASENVTVSRNTGKFVVVATLAPNPFTENFNLSLTTCSEEMVNIAVYDMVGKLIEQLELQPSDLEGLKIGNRYSSGVYNIIVQQGSEMKTLRAVKR